MDSQFSNTHAQFSTDFSSEQFFPANKLENNGDYWNDLMVDALGESSHDMQSNIEDFSQPDHQDMQL